MLVDSFLLRTSPRWITLEPAGPAVAHDRLLYIDRATLDASLRSRADCAALAEPDSQRVVYGLVGLIDTLHDAHLLVVAEREPVGHVLGNAVWRVRTLEAVPVRGQNMLKHLAPALALDKTDLADEASLRAMLAAAVRLPGFYFSHGLDLSRCAQNRADRAATAAAAAAAAAVAAPGDPPAAAEPDFARADPRFVWNRFAAQRLLDVGAVAWVTPLILGYVAVCDGMVNGRAVTLALVSRRGADRPGLRFTARGADVHGHCSNFVETEQLVAHGAQYASYVQVRGSIPLLWKQEACIRYKPRPELKRVGGAADGAGDDDGDDGDDDDDIDDDAAGGRTMGKDISQRAFERHFETLFAQYGPVTAVSLIDQRGGEALLYGAFQKAVDAMHNARLRFLPWDFHAHTAGMKYERVDTELMALLDADLEAYSYFLTTDGTSGGVTRRQHGVVRTNCIDSLDRTNVVQSVIAHRALDAALTVMGVLDGRRPDADSVARFDAFEHAFKNAWADHANAQSRVYAGSAALKTDFTRTGRRSKPGMAQDGLRALRRYVYQNVLDGQRQDGIDLLLGVVQMPSKAEREIGRRGLGAMCTTAEPLLVKEKYLPHLMLICMVVCAAGIVLPQSPATKAMVSGLALASVVLIGRMILKVGHKLAARPRLNGTH